MHLQLYLVGKCRISESFCTPWTGVAWILIGLRHQNSFIYFLGYHCSKILHICRYLLYLTIFYYGILILESFWIAWTRGYDGRWLKYQKMVLRGPLKAYWKAWYRKKYNFFCKILAKSPPSSVIRGRKSHFYCKIPISSQNSALR